VTAVRSVGRITTNGKITIFPEAGSPEDIVTGADHNLWITNVSGPSNLSSIARLTPAGQFTYRTVPNQGEAWDLTSGPGGNLWFTDIRSDSIDRLTVP